LKDIPSRGTVTFDDRYFTDEMRPQVQSRPYTIGPHATAEVSFPVSPRHINLSTSYAIPITVTDNDGSTVKATEEVGFRACERATRPITIDGDLGDWNLEAATAIPFSREFTVWGKADKPLCTGELYTRWDDNNLYFAVTVKKHDAFTHRANDIGIWTDDNIMFGLYPWRWKRGETVNSGFYREHLGLCADGVARIFRVGNVAGGATTAEGAQIAVRQTAEGYIYEWRYARQSLYPLELKAGAGFRLSMFALDSDPALGLRGIQIGGFNENVDARPERWREFVLAN
jgi:hypothetical protein